MPAPLHEENLHVGDRSPRCYGFIRAADYRNPFGQSSMYRALQPIQWTSGYCQRQGAWNLPAEAASAGVTGGVTAGGVTASGVTGGVLGGVGAAVSSPATVEASGRVAGGSGDAVSGRGTTARGWRRRARAARLGLADVSNLDGMGALGSSGGTECLAPAVTAAW